MSQDYLDSASVAHAPSLPQWAPQHEGSAATEPVSLQLARFVDAYRQHGCRIARVDPLGLTTPPDVPELTPQFHRLDPLQTLDGNRAVFPAAATVRELENQLKRVYCGAIGLDCSGVRNERRRRWLYARMESVLSSAPPRPQERSALLRHLVAAEMWERHVATSLPHAKRFSLEGCESLVPLVEAVIEQGSRHGVRQIFMGMPHRGRLNVLINVMGFDAATMFACLDKTSEVAAAQHDLPYHRGAKAHRQTPHGEVGIVLAPNPSHLESVYPVVCGMARAFSDENPGLSCLPLVIHGDAAFAGQGVVPETLNLTRRRGYAAGGTVHVIVNNQIGFTTLNRMNVHADEYCTDVARMVDAPVIRVNADHPDDVASAVAIALDYRVAHGSDVIIDLVGYRRLGHSEQDLPAVTQPFLQAAIAAHPTVTELYHGALDERTALDVLRAEAVENLLTRGTASVTTPQQAGAPMRTSTSTGTERRDVKPLAALSPERLRELSAVLTTPPEGVQLHEYVRKQTGRWRDAVASGDGPVDWCFAENLAYASLLGAGHSIRISGMDVGRGTFMHRLAVWHGQTGVHQGKDAHVPLRHVAHDQGEFHIVDSPLTEEAVLGFEYGYSVQAAKRLTIWEAQYGDFANGAQVIIDQYIASGEYKWGCQSALAMLLPHGHEGVGPEHSTGYLSRFLQLCADDNLRVVMPSTSSQWFHLLREQAAKHSQPKPLIVMSPKFQLYGNEQSHAPLHALTSGGFAPVIGDAGKLAPEAATRVVLCAGKLYYELLAARDAADGQPAALVRIEQLYPFPRRELAAVLARFPRVTEIVWAQEEEKNHGAWHFVRDELEALLPSGSRLSHVCRTATPAGAHASILSHQREQRRLIAAALKVEQPAR